MSLGPLTITTAAIDGMYSLTTAIELSSMDDTVMTDKRMDCDHCGQRDGCSGTCPLAAEMTKDEVRRDG